MRELKEIRLLSLLAALGLLYVGIDRVERLADMGLKPKLAKS
jgi:hypothetical protein